MPLFQPDLQVPPKRQGCQDSQDIPESSILLLMIIILYCHFLTNLPLSCRVSVSIAFIALHSCSNIYNGSLLAVASSPNISFWLSRSFQTCLHVGGAAPHNTIWGKLTLLSLHFLFCKIGIAVSILQVYDKDTTRRDM